MCIKKNINVNLNLSRLTSMVERIFTQKKKCTLNFKGKKKCSRFFLSVC